MKYFLGDFQEGKYQQTNYFWKLFSSEGREITMGRKQQRVITVYELF